MTKPNIEAELYFICVDSFSFPAVLAQVRGMGIPIPPEAIKVIDIFNMLSVILKKLNLTFKFEAGVVVGARREEPDCTYGCELTDYYTI